MAAAAVRTPSHLLLQHRLHRRHPLRIRAAAAAGGNIHLVRGLVREVCGRNVRYVVDSGIHGLAVLARRDYEEGDHYTRFLLHALGNEGEHALLVARLAGPRLLVQVADQLIHRAHAIVLVLREPRGYRAEVEVEDVRGLAAFGSGVCFGRCDAQVSRLDELARENSCVPLLHLLIDLEDLEA